MSQLLKFNKNIRVRMLLNFFTVFTSALVMPYTIIYFANYIGAALTTTMIIIIGIISMIGYIIGGSATDYYGRKIVIILSEVVVGLGFLVISYFDSLTMFYATPILIAFGIVFFFQSGSNPAYSAIIIDSTDESERRSVYTYFIWLNSIAFALGSVIGGFYFENHSDLLYALMGITSLISAILTFLLIQEQMSDRDEPKINKEAYGNANHNKLATFKKNLIGVFAYRLFLYLSLGTFLLNVMSEQLYNYISIRIVDEYQSGEFSITGYQMMGYLHLEDTIIMTLTAGVILKLTNRLSDKSSLMMGLIFNITGYIILSYFVHPLSLVTGMLFIAVGFLIYRPVEQTIIADVIPDKSRGKYLSILGLMAAFGGMVSGLFIWGSEYISVLGISFIFFLIGIIILLNFLYVIKHVEKESAENN